jgi:ribosomal protein S18 acetylase RimI-like enzyme
MDLSIRRGTIADVGPVLRLWSEAGVEPSHTDDVESLLALVVHDPDALIVARVADRLVGTVIAGWDGWRGSIYRLVVAPSERRRGVGRQLLDQAEARLARAGATRIQAVVVETDPLATRFWEATRWEQQVERLRFVKG